MRSVVGWTIEVDSPVRAWVNGLPVCCTHRHRTKEALHACIVKKMLSGNQHEIHSAKYEPALPVGKPRSISQRLDLCEVLTKLDEAGVGLQQLGEPVTHPHTDHAVYKDYRRVCSHTCGSTPIHKIVEAINRGVV